MGMAYGSCKLFHGRSIVGTLAGAHTARQTDVYFCTLLLLCAEVQKSIAKMQASDREKDAVAIVVRALHVLRGKCEDLCVLGS